MGSYGVLMFVSFLLWQAANGAAGAEALLGLSDSSASFASYSISFAILEAVVAR